MKNHATFMWNVAEVLHGTYKQQEIGRIVLPFTLLARLDALLTAPDEGQRLTFHNRSGLDLQQILQHTDTAEQSLTDYVEGFSPMLRETFEGFGFQGTASSLAQEGLLLDALRHFTSPDLSPGAVDNAAMGAIFDELLELAAAADASTTEPETAPVPPATGLRNDPAGVAHLMASLLVDVDAEENLASPERARSVYDPAACNGESLAAAERLIAARAPGAQVNLLAREADPQAFAACRASLFLRGQPIGNTRLGGALPDPAPTDRGYDLGVSIPRPGSESSLQLLMHVASSLRRRGVSGGPAGRGAVVLDAASLTRGGAGSRDADTRLWLLDNDYLEALIELPSEASQPTNGRRYLWVINAHKPEWRRDRVQLIDASALLSEGSTPASSENGQLSEADIESIVALYSEGTTSEHSVFVKNKDFLYRSITVERPLQLGYSFAPERVERVLASKTVAKMHAGDRDGVARALAAGEAALGELLGAGVICTSRKAFTAMLNMVLAGEGIFPKPPQLKNITGDLAAHDPEGEMVLASGREQPDSDLRTTLHVPLKQDVHEYLEREVIPGAPGAWIDASKTKIGAEIGFSQHFAQ